METRIALCGPPGSGKSTIAREFGNTVISFADALRLEVATALGGSGRDIDHHAAAMVDSKLKDRYRPILQAWGTFRRQLDPEYWLRPVEDLLGQRGMNKQIIVVDDCRYDNEYAMLRRLGFLFVRLEEGATTRKQVESVLRHASELEWPKFNFDLLLPYKEGPSIQARALARGLADAGLL